eukprot:5893978-Alexandrium_andersonii.AAC.1
MPPQTATSAGDTGLESPSGPEGVTAGKSGKAPPARRSGRSRGGGQGGTPKADRTAGRWCPTSRQLRNRE